MTTLKFLFVSALLVLFTVGSVTADNPFQHPGFVLAHYAQDNHNSAYLSPDDKYVARISYEDNEVKGGVTLLTIYRKGSRNDPLAVFSGVEGFGWVPERQHTFIVSSDGGHNGIGTVILWAAKKRSVVLLHGRELEDDNFNVKQISGDGTKVIYEHFGYGVSEKHPEQGQGLQQLNLPAL